MLKAQFLATWVLNGISETEIWVKWERTALLPCRNFRRHSFDPWVQKIPWRRKWQPTPVFLPGEFPWTEEPGGLQSMGSQVGHD